MTHNAKILRRQFSCEWKDVVHMTACNHRTVVDVIEILGREHINKRSMNARPELAK